MKLLHTPITVKDMDESIRFYTERLGMSLLSRRKIKQNDADTTFLWMEGTDHRIELIWRRRKTDYAEGTSSTASPSGWRSCPDWSKA